MNFMKLIYANHKKSIVNAEYIVSMKVLYTSQLKTGEEMYSIVADTINDRNYIIEDRMSEERVQRQLKKIGEYLCSDASFLIDFAEEY